MSEPPEYGAGRPSPRGRLWPALLGGLVLLGLAGAGLLTGPRFFASLRIARPQAVSVRIPAFSGPSGTHRLQDAVAAMLADSIYVAREQRDSTVGDAVAAGRLAGFAAALPALRNDSPTLTVEGLRAVSMALDRSRLRTILVEAGRPHVTVPASLDGAVLALTTPPGIRARYGHCPPTQGTLTQQIIGSPARSTDYGDCVVLVERGGVTGQVPPGLDMAELCSVALEVAGMSPRQSAAFQHIIDWRAALALRMPGFIRSYEMARVGGRPAMLLNTGGRRGPTWELIWQQAGHIFAMAGYGSASDALPLAESVH